MSRHTTYRGVTIDMDSMRRDNEKSPALGNMNVNAKGDLVSRTGVITPVAQIARENHRVKTSVVKTGLKGALPASPAVVEQVKPAPIAATVKKTKETELPSGDIVVEDDDAK